MFKTTFPLPSISTHYQLLAVMSDYKRSCWQRFSLENKYFVSSFFALSEIAYTYIFCNLWRRFWNGFAIYCDALFAFVITETCTCKVFHSRKIKLLRMTFLLPSMYTSSNGKSIIRIQRVPRVASIITCTTPQNVAHYYLYYSTE